MKTLLIVMVMLILPGCVSMATKTAMHDFDAAPLVYGVVTSTAHFTDNSLKGSCESGRIRPELRPACEKPEENDFIRVAILSTNRLITRWMLAPAADKIEEDFIVRYNGTLDVAHSYLGIAQKEATEDCRWHGITPKFQNSAAGFTAGFALGLLIVPSLALFTDSAQLGGIECDGWSYKTIWERAKQKAASSDTPPS